MRKNKIGRNELCWCGSGKKFKKCHTGREEAEPAKISDFLDTGKKAFGKEFCLYPSDSKSECDGKIVKAHTVQRAALAKIAEDGHVYGFVPDANVLQCKPGKEELLVVQRIGIKKASTFTGFCAKHDNKIFKVIEDDSFICCVEHAFLLGYRALCHAVFMKKAALEMKDHYHNMDSGQPIEIQRAIQEFAIPFMKGTKLGHDDLARIKREYDTILKNKSLKKIKYYAIFFDKLPDVLSSGSFWPVFDFNGNKVQEPIKPNPEGIQISLITMKQGGAAVFTWLEENGVSESFIKTLHRIKDSRLPSTIVRFIFEYFENIYFKISWWNSLNESQKKKLHQRALMIMGHEPDCLMEDGLRVVDWQVTSRKTNIEGF